MNQDHRATRIIGKLSNNIYAVADDDELVVFDPGMPSDLRRLVERIKSLGRSPKDVTAIVLTHFHVDHAGCAAELQRISDARIYIHAEDAPYLQGEKHIPSVFKAGVQGRALMVLPKTVEKYSQVPPVKADVSFSHGDVLPILGGLEAYHAPGHTPGSACFLSREKGALFTGDVIQNLYFALTLPEPGFCWDMAMAGRSAAAFVDAVADEDYLTIYTGHGPIVRSGAKAKMARFGVSLRKRGKA